MIARKFEEVPYKFKYSIFTLVTNHSQYNRMVDSFLNNGFSRDIAEYIYFDNTKINTFNAYHAINCALKNANGQYVIFCHQDIVLLSDNENCLSDKIEEIDKIDSSWALLGNAGGVHLGKLALRITDPHGFDQSTATFPAKVHSLDENFIIIKSSARLSVSENSIGYHCYGLEICLVASLFGYNSYVIDFHLEHLSPGNVKDVNSKSLLSFYGTRDILIHRYSVFFSGRYIQTTCTSFYLGGCKISRLFFNLKIVKKIYKKLFV